jgi:membrane protease subunit (stomatin/prohibitin family)
MGLFDIFKKQFIDVIDWTDDEPGILSFRYPMMDREIQNGAKLTVRNTQLAMFVNEGQVADLFQPGLHTLTTNTLPILTTLRNWDKAFQSPFKSDVIFFTTKEQIDQRWGTPNPIIVNDAKYGSIRIRANGIYSFKISKPQIFFNKLSGVKEVYRIEDLSNQLRSMIITSMASFLGNMQVSFVEMAANQVEFSAALKKSLASSFALYGLSLETFFIQSISLPEELQQYFDKASSMNFLGDLKKYAQFQTAESITMAAQNEGGIAGVGAGAGVGMAIGQTMKDLLNTGSTGQTEENPLETIQKLHELFKNGVLTQEEFDSKKAELLKKIK